MKRGELTSEQIILLVLAIIGFVIVLIVLAVYFDSSNDSGRELCRLSVLTRATSITTIQAQTPLRCQTEKICITSKLLGGECKQFAGEKNVRTVKLSSNSGEAIRQIEEESANALYDCWNMMGQGKLDLFGKGTILATDKPTCVVCSRVAFADDVSDNLLEKVNVQKYMENTQVPGSSLTYLETLSDRGTKTFASTEDLDNNTFKSDNSILDAGDRQTAFVFSQFKTASISNYLKNYGLGVGTGAFVFANIPLAGSFATKLVLGNPVTATIAGVAVAGAGAYVGWNAYNSQQAAMGYCGKISTTADDLSTGCSLVQAVPYTVKNINMLCPGQIQGEP